MDDYKIGEGASSSHVDLRALFVETFRCCEEAECAFGSVCLEALKALKEVIVGPNFFLNVSNST
jgi:hypothetical protein